MPNAARTAASQPTAAPAAPTVAEQIAQVLQRYGVAHIFGQSIPSTLLLAGMLYVFISYAQVIGLGLENVDVD